MFLQTDVETPPRRRRQTGDGSHTRNHLPTYVESCLLGVVYGGSLSCTYANVLVGFEEMDDDPGIICLPFCLTGFCVNCT